jgi:hypothetical protein
MIFGQADPRRYASAGRVAPSSGAPAPCGRGEVARYADHRLYAVSPRRASRRTIKVEGAEVSVPKTQILVIELITNEP